MLSTLIITYKKNKLTLISHGCLIFSVLLNIVFCINLNGCGIELPDSTNKPDLTLNGFYQQGRVLASNDFVKGNNVQHIPINFFRAVSFEISKQTTGEKLWEQLYNYPRYGLGIYYASFIHCSEIGTPVALYGSLEIPILRWKQFSLNSDFGFGFAFNWESYGEDKYNIALGAEESVYIDDGISLEYKLNSGLLFGLEASFTHFSNGALKKPNFGINLITPKISLGYNFNSSRKEFKHQIVPAYQKQSECLLSFFSGWRNELYQGNDVDTATQNKGVYYPSYGLSATFYRQLGYRSKFGVGLMADYRGAANSSIVAENGKLVDKDASFRDGLEISIFPSYELLIDKLSVLLQPGFYLYRTKYLYRNPAVYQRIGFKYKLFRDLSIGVILRAYNYNISDYIEWTIGYSFHI